ncbi:MAG TPA: ABC transporter ATP-binding protein [Chloroflexota bacterium]|jgi:oligopeptide/dipeptide ABC transporter ATP-binding protein
MNRSEPLLRIRNLVVEFVSDGRVSRAVDGVSLEICPGETVGLVGETGCGKSVTALSVLGLIPSPPGRVVEGEILFEGHNLVGLASDSLRKLRGEGISMVFQEPMTSLDPSFTVGSQMTEVLTAHRSVGGSSAKAEARRMLELVRMPHAQRVLSQYSFELSGGMRQRVMIAMALLCQPRLLIADEPTTALDVTVQAQILALLDDLRQETGTAILLITHDLGIVAENCDRVYVMYAGRIAETADVEDLFSEQLHPYTRGLIGAIPDLTVKSARLVDIPGDVARADTSLPGCRFAPRCPNKMAVCTGEPPTMRAVGSGREVACYLHG